MKKIFFCVFSFSLVITVNGQSNKISSVINGYGEMVWGTSIENFQKLYSQAVKQTGYNQKNDGSYVKTVETFQHNYINSINSEWMPQYSRFYFNNNKLYHVVDRYVDYVNLNNDAKEKIINEIISKYGNPYRTENFHGGKGKGVWEGIRYYLYCNKNLTVIVESCELFTESIDGYEKIGNMVEVFYFEPDMGSEVNVSAMLTEVELKNESK